MHYWIVGPTLLVKHPDYGQSLRMAVEVARRIYPAISKKIGLTDTGLPVMISTALLETAPTWRYLGFKIEELPEPRFFLFRPATDHWDHS